MIADAELLRRFSEQGCHASFAEIVTRHAGFVYAAASRQLGGATHRAEEVTQAVFVDLARKAAEVSRRREIAGWLYTGAHYAAAKLKRTEQRRQRREAEAHAMNEITAASNPAVDWDRLSPVLDDAMHVLDEADRDAILLRYFQGLRFTEIGRRLNVTDDAARRRVERALDRLRGELGRRRITSTAAAIGLVLANQPSVAIPAGLVSGVTKAALAGASAAAGGWVAMAFMSTKSTLGFVAAVALAIGFAVHETRESRRMQAELAVLTAERIDLQTQLRDLRQGFAARERLTADLQRQLQSATVLKSATAFAMPGPTSAEVQRSAGRLSLGSMSPSEIRTRNGNNIDAAYAALYRQLGWSTAERKQFRDAMLARTESGERLFRAAVATAQAKNPKIDRAERFEVFEATNAQVQVEQQADVRRIFGEAAGRAMEHFQETLPVRPITNQLATALFNSETPLTPTQADRLVDVLARHSRGPLGKVDVRALNLEAAVNEIAVQGLLNGAQLEALRRATLIVQENKQAELEWNTVPAASLKAGASIRGP
jgi:RNA polymerase sigma factor (sigma-70 family)